MRKRRKEMLDNIRNFGRLKELAFHSKANPSIP
jgi:hypothetical protein